MYNGGMTEIRIEYVRPGKDTTFYLEEVTLVDTRRLKTFKVLPPDAVERLSRSLVAEGLIAPDQRAVRIAKLSFSTSISTCWSSITKMGIYSAIILTSVHRSPGPARDTG